MATIVQRRKGTAAQNATFTGAEGEFVYLTDEKRVVTHDGITAGGEKQAKLSEVELVANKSTNVALGASNTLYPTQNAVKTYVDAATAGGTPGGADMEVQFNDAGAFGGDSGFTYNKNTDAITLGIESSLDDTSGLLIGLTSLVNPSQISPTGSARFSDGALTISTAGAVNIAGTQIQLFPTGGAQFANGSFVIGDSGITTIQNIVNDVPLTIIQSLTGASNSPLFDAAITWNTTGIPSAIKLDVTNVASNSASRLLDLQVGSVSRFNVRVDGVGTLLRQEADDSGGGLDIAKRGTTGDATGAVVGGFSLGGVTFKGWDTATFAQGGNIRMIAAETFSPTAHGASLQFQVATPTTTTVATAMTLASSGLTVVSSLTAGNALFNVTGTTGVLKLANGTDPAANPTNATTQWAVGGEWQYRSSAASEGAGQTNRVHNRAAEVVGSGTDYTLTNAYARVDFGTQDPEITLPTAGTYYIVSHVQFSSSALSANDLHDATLYNSTDSAFVGVANIVQLGVSYQAEVIVSAVYTVTASKTIQLWAANLTAARGTIVSGRTTIKYIRLY